jgi:hypothetical protein
MIIIIDKKSLYKFFVNNFFKVHFRHKHYVTLLIDSHATINLNHSTYKSSRHY